MRPDDYFQLIAGCGIAEEILLPFVRMTIQAGNGVKLNYPEHRLQSLFLENFSARMRASE